MDWEVMRRYLMLLLLVFAAGCNLDTSASMTLTAVIPPTSTYVAPTPYIAPIIITPVPGQSFSAQGVVITPTPGNLLTPVPAQQLINNPAPSQSSQNAIEAFINNLIVPLWNFLYTFVLQGAATLWVFAGARGGAFAQVFCCIAPAILLVIVVALRLRVVRWRWR